MTRKAKVRRGEIVVELDKFLELTVSIIKKLEAVEKEALNTASEHQTPTLRGVELMLNREYEHIGRHFYPFLLKAWQARKEEKDALEVDKGGERAKASGDGEVRQRAPRRSR